MSSRDYPVVVYPLGKEDGGGFAAIAPDLPGCKGDGDTAQTAMADLYSAIDEWVDECRALGRVVPLPGTYVSKKIAEQDQIIGVVKAQAAALKQQDELIKGRLAETQAGLVALEVRVVELLERHKALHDDDFPGMVAGLSMAQAMSKVRGGRMTH
jgi:antitoxin HicB